MPVRKILLSLSLPFLFSRESFAILSFISVFKFISFSFRLSFQKERNSLDFGVCRSLVILAGRLSGWHAMSMGGRKPIALE